MARQTLPAAFISATLAATALPAAADVTPDDVWAAFRAQLGGYGTITANEARSGDTLNVSNIVMRTDVEDATSILTIAETITFRPLSGGRVAIDIPEQIAATLSMRVDGTEAADVSYLFTQSGMQIEASGAPGDIVHNFTAPRMAYSLGDFTASGDGLEGDIDVTMTNAAGNWRSVEGDLRELIADYTVGALTVTGAFDDKTEGGRVQLDAELSDLEVDTTYTVPEAVASLSPQQIFSAGLSGSSVLAYGSGQFTVAVTANGSTTNIEGTLGSGALDAAIDGAEVTYRTEANDFAAAGSLSNLPFPPIEVSYDRSSFDLSMPLAQTDGPRDFGLGVSLQGLKVSDFLWGMIDPQGQLPRDAADVVLDIDGKGNWLVDILDPAAAETLKGKALGALESVTLQDLQVKIAGAELTGKGDFTFDNSDTSYFSGMPRPIGAIDLALSGGITLLDKLTALGLVQQQQAVGIKMMSGLFAQPGDGPDTLKSTIAIDPSGKILANGVALQ